MNDESLAAAIADAAPDAIIFADRGGVIRFWNRAAETVFGHAAADAVGRNLDLIIPERLRAAHWEGFDKAWFYKLDNVIGIIDVNRLGQRGETDLGWNTGAYAARARAFGWHAIEVDGHDLAAIDRAYAEAVSVKGQPTCIVARTEKGHGVSFVEADFTYHGKALTAEEARRALEELGWR